MKRAVISFPKSGRTWLRYALLQAAPTVRIRFSHCGFESNDGSRPPLDFSEEYHRREISKEDRFVFLARDPRDVAVSLYHQVTGRFRDFFGYKGTLQEFIRDSYFGIDNVINFQLVWFKIAEENSSGHIVWYEEMMEDFARTFSAMAEHLMVDLSRRTLRTPKIKPVLKACEEWNRRGSLSNPGCAHATVLQRCERAK